MEDLKMFRGEFPDKPKNNDIELVTLEEFMAKRKSLPKQTNSKHTTIFAHPETKVKR